MLLIMILKFIKLNFCKNKKLPEGLFSHNLTKFSENFNTHLFPTSVVSAEAGVLHLLFDFENNYLAMLHFYSFKIKHLSKWNIRQLKKFS